MMKTRAVALALGVAALSSPAWAQTYPPEPQPLVIDKSVVRPGDLVTVRGGGAEPGANVTITFESTPEEVATVEAGADGTFEATFRIPLDATPGTHLISAISGGRVLGTVTVTVLSAESLPVTGREGRLLPFLVIGALALVGFGSLLLIRRRAARTG